MSACLGMNGKKNLFVVQLSVYVVAQSKVSKVMNYLKSFNLSSAAMLRFLSICSHGWLNFAAELEKTQKEAQLHVVCIPTLFNGNILSFSLL